MADMHDVLRSLKGKMDPEKNLKSYAEIIKEDSYGYAYVSFALQYTALLEELYVSETEETKDTEVYLSELLKLIGEMDELVRAYLSGEKVEFSEVDAIRKENTALMERLTAETDLFALCEYMMNRIEHGFIGDLELPAGYSDIAMTDEIMAYLGGQKEEAQNLAIQMLIEQLPVRMTKNRFYEAVTERLSIYKNSDYAALANILKVIRSVSGLIPLSEEDAVGTSLSSIYEEFRNPETSELTEDRFRDLQTELIADASSLNVNMDLGEIFQVALNAFGALVLSTPKDFEGVSSCQWISEAVLRMMTEENSAEMDAVYEACEALEGLPENFIEVLTTDLSSLEWTVGKYADSIQANGLSEDFTALKNIGTLTSNSTFAPLSADEKADMDVTDEIFRKEVLKLIQEISEILTGASRRFSRAVMALVNGELPPRFSSQEELENYIYSALSNCSNVPEKLGVMDLISDIMNQ